MHRPDLHEPIRRIDDPVDDLMDPRIVPRGVGVKEMGSLLGARWPRHSDDQSSNLDYWDPNYSLFKLIDSQRDGIREGCDFPCIVIE